MPRTCVGVKGSRVQSVVRELRGEKVDIVEWSNDLATYLSNSLSPAVVDQVEIDEAAGGIVKINPLVDWSHDDVWSYVRSHEIPVNRLHAKGYPSVGCAPCTRPVREGEDPRSGRWWWELPETKECGLHVDEESEGSGI